MSTNFLDKWAKCQDFIRDNIGESRFNIWFRSTKAVSFENNVLTLELPTHYYYERYEDEFYKVLSASITKEFGPDTRLNYKVRVIQDVRGTVNLEPSNRSKVVGTKLDMAQSRPANPSERKEDVSAPDIDSNLNPVYTFENYCVGRSNHLVCTIAETIAANPRNSNFNPFFLFGDVGVGKTHLIQAIGIRIKEKNPRAKVVYTTAREFQHLYAIAAIEKTIPDFINWFMGLDVLLLDDLQEIAHKVKTSEVLFPIFNHLHQSGKQLIFTCDRPPMELDGMTDRLIDRFKWGITERLPKPDEALRRDILTFKAKKNGIDLPQDVIDYVARHAINSVREIEGIVMGILTQSITTNSPITLESAKRVVANFVKTKVRRQVNFDIILEATAEFYRVNPDVIFSPSRVRDIADARQVVMYLCNKHTSLSSTAIGMKMNRRHATVLHGINAVRDRMATNTEFARAVSSIESEIL